MGERSIFQQVQDTFIYLRERLPIELQKPRFAIICGSGLGGLAASVNKSPRAEFEYGSIPHFPISTGKFWIIFSLYIVFYPSISKRKIKMEEYNLLVTIIIIGC